MTGAVKSKTPQKLKFQITDPRVSKFLTRFQAQLSRGGGGRTTRGKTIRKSAIFSSRKFKQQQFVKPTKKPTKISFAFFAPKRFKPKFTTSKKTKSISISRGIQRFGKKPVKTATPEQQAFTISQFGRTSTRTRKAGIFTKIEKFGKAFKLQTKKQVSKPSGFLVFNVADPTIAGGVSFFTPKLTDGERQAKDSLDVTPAKFIPTPIGADLGVPTPDDGGILGGILDFFNDLFGVSGGSGTERAGDTSTTSITLLPAQLPSQEGDEGFIPPEIGGGLFTSLGGAPDEVDGKGGILNAIIKDPANLALAFIAVVALIAGIKK